MAPHNVNHVGLRGQHREGGRDCSPSTSRTQKVYVAPDTKQKVRSIEGQNFRGYAGPEGAPTPPSKYTVSKVTVGFVMVAGNVVNTIVSGARGIF